MSYIYTLPQPLITSTIVRNISNNMEIHNLYETIVFIKMYVQVYLRSYIHIRIRICISTCTRTRA